MRNLIASALLLTTATTATAQINWVPCAMPFSTLMSMTMGPNGELVANEATNPIHPKVSTDGGQTWNTKAGVGGPNGNLLSEDLLHMTVTGTYLVWGSVNGGAAYSLWRSTDMGDSFTQMGSANGIPANRYFMGFCSGPNGDVYLYGQGVLRSTDDGQTWTSIVASGTSLTGLTANTTNIFGVQLGTVYKGALDGTGFAAISIGTTNITNGLEMARGMNERILCVGGSGRVITSTDNGSTWATATTGMSNQPTEIAHIAASLSSDTWVAGKQNQVYFTSAAGAPWVSGTAGLSIAQNEPIQGIFCDSTGTFYLYAYFHLYRSNITVGMSSPAKADEGIAYPNPTSGELRVPVAFIGKACDVIDASGRSVLNLTVGAEPVIDLGALPNGRYQVRTADGKHTLPVQVQH